MKKSGRILGLLLAVFLSGGTAFAETEAETQEPPETEGWWMGSIYTAEGDANLTLSELRELSKAASADAEKADTSVVVKASVRTADGTENKIEFQLNGGGSRGLFLTGDPAPDWAYLAMNEKIMLAMNGVSYYEVSGQLDLNEAEGSDVLTGAADILRTLLEMEGIEVSFPEIAGVDLYIGRDDYLVHTVNLDLAGAAGTRTEDGVTTEVEFTALTLDYTTLFWYDSEGNRISPVDVAAESETAVTIE